MFITHPSNSINITHKNIIEITEVKSTLMASRPNVITPTVDIPNLLVFIRSFKITFCITYILCHVHVAGLQWKLRQTTDERETMLLVLLSFGSLPQVSVTIPVLHRVASTHFYTYLTKWTIHNTVVSLFWFVQHGTFYSATKDHRDSMINGSKVVLYDRLHLDETIHVWKLDYGFTAGAEESWTHIIYTLVTQAVSKLVEPFIITAAFARHLELVQIIRKPKEVWIWNLYLAALLFARNNASHSQGLALENGSGTGDLAEMRSSLVL